MDPVGGADQLLEGRRALEGARWDAARAAFEAALEAEETPEARHGLGEALWFLGDVQEGIAEVERAFEGYVRRGQCDEAARAAVWVSHQYALSGRTSAARGWLSRAERALTGVATCKGHGWVEVERARHAASVEECLERSERAMAIGRELGAADLEVYALSLLGRAQVDAGHRRIGLVNWTPTGQVGEMLKIIGRYLPAPPDYASPPPLWGSEEHLRELFADTRVELEFDRGHNPWRFDSAEHWVVFMETHYGPMLKVRERLTAEGRWEECRGELLALAERYNEATDGSLLMQAEYLIVVGRKT